MAAARVDSDAAIVRRVENVMMEMEIIFLIDGDGVLWEEEEVKRRDVYVGSC